MGRNKNFDVLGALAQAVKQFTSEERLMLLKGLERTSQWILKYTS